jgi:hypothetical protein
MRRHSSFIFIGVLAAAAALAAGCANHPEIRTDKDPTANIAAPKTFGFFNPLATDKARYSTLVTARLKAAARTQLEQRGYVYSEETPDLKVNFFVNVQDRQDVRTTTPAGRGFYGYRLGYRAWGAYPYDIETVSYKQGTLAIDVIDSNRNTLVWQGVAQGRLDAKTMKNPTPTIDKVVGEIFASFPGKTETKSLAAAK